MSEIEVKKITDRAGTGSPNFPHGVEVAGTDSGLLAPTRTEGETQPDAETSSNGDTFYDTANDTYDVLIEGAWVRVLGAGGGGLVEWTIDLSNTSYDNVSFNTSSQEDPRGLAFSNDGTKAFICGPNTDAIYQYSLSTGFDLSTASYDSVSFNVTGQGFNPTGLAFNTDGTKMFWVGYTNDTVFQYSLSTGFDLSTASYDNASFSIASQENSAHGVAFNYDGTRMYVMGYASDQVHQYSLTTAFDVNTASYDSVAFSLASQDATPQGFGFNPQGTQMFVSGSSNDRVYQYSLSTGWDLSSASYDGKFLSVGSQDTFPYNIAFNTDGTKMFLAGGNNDNVYQYSTGL